MEDDDLDGFEKYEASNWFAAIREADTWRDTSAPDAPAGPRKTGDMSRLVALLSCRLVDERGQVTLTREECELLIDLLSRHHLKQKQGGRRRPAYKRSSWADLKLAITGESVRYYQSRGLSLDAAIERVLSTGYYPTINQNSLKLYMEGRYHRDRLLSAPPR